MDQRMRHDPFSNGTRACALEMASRTHQTSGKNNETRIIRVVLRASCIPSACSHRVIFHNRFQLEAEQLSIMSLFRYE